jgi:hypothetical protein
LGDWGVLQRTRRRLKKSPELICWQPGSGCYPCSIIRARLPCVRCRR